MKTPKRYIAKVLAGVAVLATVASSQAAIRDTVTFNGWECTQTTNPNEGTLRSHSFPNSGYTLGKITWSGTITKINPAENADWLLENLILVKTPTGACAVMPLGTVTGYTSPAAISGDFNIDIGATTPFAAPWEFRYFNTYDDGDEGLADASIDITINLTDEVPTITPPSAEDLGEIGDPGTTVNRTLDANQIKWFKFSISEMTGAKFFDIATFGSDMDTEIGVYDKWGNLIANDDDGGTGLDSLLSFGSASAGHGGNGDLCYAGEYYLAVGNWDMEFGGNFGVTGGGPEGGALVVAFTTDIGGGGGGASTFVNPSTYTVLEGSEVNGNLQPLLTSDDNALCLFNDEITMGCAVEFRGSVFQSFSTLTYIVESSVTRPGLSVGISLFNFMTNSYNFVDGAVATTTDTTREVVISSNVSRFTNENGDLRSRVSWLPINDEDPAQDGWLHCVDRAVWKVQ